MSLNSNIIKKVNEKASTTEHESAVITVLESVEKSGYGKPALKKVLNNLKQPE